MLNNKNKNKSSFTFTEVQKHNTPSNAWTIIHNKVYHIPESWILHDHPGGEIIRNAMGRDATEIFDFIGHSANAKQKLATFYIGNLIRD